MLSTNPLTQVVNFAP